MNKHLHRIVFNAARGMRMVVQETALSAGKATGATSAVLATALAGLLAVSPAPAQIVGAPDVAPGLRPTVLVAPNGVPLVNIQTPSAAGVSRNLYHQFDVQPRGVILNNSRTDVQTQLGGWVQANPWLANGPARIILNEVTSGNPTQLRGAIEVGGQRAEVIVANPAGIAVDGSTFINASRATLTTGTPQLNAFGGLDGYVVRGGTVSIDGAGFDARSTDYAAILTRAIKVNAALWANELKVVTGANQVSADHGQVTPTTGTGTAPVFGLDVAQLGGMYAGKIFLIGREAGVGARNAGTIMAADGSGPLSGPGEFVITAAGRLENIGTIQAARRAAIAAESLVNSGRITSGGELKIATQGTLANAGTLEAQSLQLASSGDIDNRGGTMRQTSGVGLTIKAPVLSNTAGGVIGAEPVPETPAQPGTGTGAGDTGTSGPATPDIGIGTGSSGGTGTAASPGYVPTPGTITAAGSILNDAGRVYVGGPIQLQTPQVNNNGGALTTTSLAVSGASFSNVGGTLNVAGSFSANVDRFDNNGGTVRAGSLQIASTGDLVNTDGKLESNADASLSAGGSLDNTRGSASATGALTANANGTIDNTAGLLVANHGVALGAQSLNNSQGSVESVTAATRLTVAQQLLNAQGFIGGATDLAIQAGSLSSSGSLRGNNDSTIEVKGALVNDGSLTSGRHTTITAGHLQGGSTSVLGAGTLADGKLGSVGDLRVTTTGALVTHGTTLAAGDATLQAASIDLSSGTTGATSIALTATQGNVTTSGATVTTPGTLNVTAVSQASQTFVNQGGQLNAGQLNLSISNLANTAGGEMVQTGSGITTIATSGTIDNSGGRFATNAQDLTLDAAGGIANSAGKIEHAGNGTLRIGGSGYRGAQGEIVGNGALAVNVAGSFSQDGGSTHARQITLDAGALSNQGGKIVQAGTAATRITVVGAANNNAGTLASNGHTTVAAGSLANQGGTIRAAETSNLGMAVGGMLDNSSNGEIGAGGSAWLNAGSLNNDGGRITAVGDLNASVAAAASNRAGTLAANGSTTLNAGTLDNSGGTVAAVSGTLNLGTLGATINVGGRLQAGGAATLSNAGLDNSSGKIFGDSLSIDTRGRALTNAQGTIAATSTAHLQSGALNNHAGLIQSGAAMVIDTHGQQLTNSGAAGYSNGQGGIASGGTLTLASGTLNNTAGFIGAKATLVASTSTVINAGGGLVLGQDNVSIDANGAGYDNRGGRTLALGDLRIDAGAIDNTGALIRSSGTTTLDTGSLANAATLGTDQGIEGRNVVISTGMLVNNTGAIRADVDTTITSSGGIDNSFGLISAGNALRITDPNAANPAAKTLGLVNSSGKLVANKSLQIDAGTFSADGQALSGQDLSIALNQDIVNNAEIAANGNLSYTTTGNFTNHGKLLAGQTLNLGGHNIENTANAEMSGTTTIVSASGTFANRGLIDSKGSTQINAGTLDNIGTGRIYGDSISIGAGVVNNDAETVKGITTSASIAARDSLDVGAGTINNRERSLIFSAGDMFIGGALDANRYATGQGATLNNLSADIESLGNMSVSMAQVDNRDVHIQKGTPTTTQSTVVQVAAMVPLDGSTFQPFEQVRLDPANGMVYLRKLDGTEELVGMGGYGVWTNYLTVTEETATNLAPARLVAGGNMTVNGRLLNQDSQVLAGGTLSATDYQSEQLSGTRTTTGTAFAINHKGEVGPLVPLTVAPASLELGAYRYEANTNATGGSAPGAAGSSANVAANAGAAGGVSGSARPGPLVEVPANIGAVAKTAGSSASSASGASGPDGTAPTPTGSDPSAVGSPGGAGGNTASSAQAGASRTVAMVVRTSTPNATVPTASLFSTRADPGSRYLVETDPRFANYRTWLNSDYLLDKLGLDADIVQKRLGDGFYEQKLIREQIAQLTGYRYLDGFQNDEEQYAALISAGATIAQAYGLSPGVALSAAQMAQLTSDIVWLVEQTVTLPDGSTQRVLVPQVYVRVRPGDIDESGALLSGDATVIKSTGDLVNAGTIAGRTMVSLSAENVAGGRIAGGSVGINAKNDINNIGASITADNAAVLTAGRDINLQSTTQSTGDGLNGATRIDRVAGVYVSNPDGVLIASAGRDVNLIGAALSSGGSVSVGAGRNINMGTVTESSRSAVFGQGMAAVGSESREIGSVIQGTGNVRLAAGNDLNIRAGAVASTEGALVATSRNDINLTVGQANSNLAVATVSSSSSLLKKTSSSTFDSSNSTEVLSSSLSGNTVALVAGSDINAQAAQLRSDEAMSLSGGRDINFTTATQTTQEAHASQTRTSTTGVGKAIGGGMVATGMPGGVIWGGALIKGGSVGTGAEAVTRNDAIGTTVSAGSLQTVSGRDTTLKAATLVADGDITMIAGRNLTIESAQNTSTEARHEAAGKSGSVGTWYNPAVGNVKNAESTATFRTTQQSSQVASLAGNATLVAGNEYRQTASSIMALGQAGPLAGGDVNILAKNVVINEVFDTEQSITLGRSSSTVLGGSASVAGLSTDSVRGAVSTVQAMGETSDSRMQALGAANLAMSGKQTYDGAQALAGSGGNFSYGVSVNLSRNESQSTSVTTSSQAVGSGVVGANNINIIATGAGQGSNIHVVGSTIAAGNTANLAADNDITLEASKDTSVTVGQNSSRGANVGVTFGAGAQNGFSIQLGVSQGKGSNNQNDTRFNATQVSGGRAVTIASGGDLTLRGAVVDGNRVTTDVGGNLNIESLQDVSVGQSRQSSSGLNVSLCIPPICYGAVATVGGSAAGAKADGVFISPNTQAGIKAGDSGFDVNVRGDTHLTGAVIESTQAAIGAGKNSFQTGGALTMSDLQNVSRSNGSGYAVSGGMSLGYTTAADATPSSDPKDGQWAFPPSGSAGVGSDSGGEQNSTTRSGISGIAGDQSVRTGDNASAGTLVRDWNTQAILRDVQAQAQIAAEFGRNASAQVGSYASGKLKEAAALYDQAAAEGDPETKKALYAQADAIERNWREGGPYRIAAHAAVSGFAGGANGAAGAAASSLAVPIIGERIAELDIPIPVKEALVMATGAAIGAVTAGASGAASAFNETSNNFLVAADLRSRDQKIRNCQANGNTACEIRVLQEYELQSASNTGQLRRSSLIEKVALQRIRGELEELLLDPAMSEETKVQARKSIKEINTAVNVIDKAPVLRDAAELGLLAVDVATLGEFAVARTLTTSVVKEFVIRRTGANISDDVAARVANNFYRDGAEFPRALATSSGAVIQPTSGRTTTVLGTYVSDTRSIIDDQLDLPKSLGFVEPKPGGFNLLNAPDDLFAKLGADRFWNQVNKPFLDAAIARSDVFYLATEPTGAALSRGGGLTGFGREYEYLKENGYIYDFFLHQMVKLK